MELKIFTVFYLLSETKQCRQIVWIIRNYEMVRLIPVIHNCSILCSHVQVLPAGGAARFNCCQTNSFTHCGTGKSALNFPDLEILVGIQF